MVKVLTRLGERLGDLGLDQLEGRRRLQILIGRQKPEKDTTAKRANK